MRERGEAVRAPQTVHGAGVACSPAAALPTGFTQKLSWECAQRLFHSSQTPPVLQQVPGSTSCGPAAPRGPPRSETAGA